MNAAAPRVDAEIKRCMAIARAKWPAQLVNYQTPVIKYDLRGRTAGTANSRANVIRLNAVLLRENQDEMIADTVPHELAHLIDAVVHPETRLRGVSIFAAYGGARIKRSARSIHGPTWRNIMRLFGRKPSRCHKMDTTNSRVSTRKILRYSYGCPGCGRAIVVGPVHHKKIQNGARYRARRCRHEFSAKDYAGVAGQPYVAPPKAPPFKFVPRPPTYVPGQPFKVTLRSTNGKLPIELALPTGKIEFDFSKFPNGNRRPAPPALTPPSAKRFQWGKPGSIGRVICEGVVAGFGTSSVLANVRAAFPDSKTSPACVAWYRTKLRKAGEIR